MFNKRGEEHHIKLVAIITVILIILAGILIIIDTLPTPKTAEEEFEIPEFVAEKIEKKTLNDNIETISIPLDNPEDCSETQVYDETLKRCLNVCANCDNETTFRDAITSFISEKRAELERKQKIFVSYKITYEGEPNAIAGDDNITDATLQKFVTNRTYERQIVSYVTKLLPLHITPNLRFIHIVTDGKIQTLSALLKNDDDSWDLSIDVVDAYKPTLDTKRLSHQLIRHFGKMYFFDVNQINKVETVSRALTTSEQRILSKTCPHNYFSAYGCMKSGSYLDDFYKEFWSELYDEWIEMDNPKILYSKYDNTFHKIDSTIDPLNDMLNAWTYFILTDEPTTQTILDKKVLFFYEYPELLLIRDWIRANLK